MLTLPAPAKLNLFLHITGRRADGYHDLQTVFQFIDLQDSISLSLRNDAMIKRVTANADVAEADDLMVKAAQLLAKAASVTRGVDIGIDKRIPMGAGLGGGSSDAATVLVGLNSLWEINFSTHQLAELGQKLGADVPVFVHGHAAWAESTGNELTFFDPPTAIYLLIVPPVHVSTAKIFTHPALTRDSSPIKIADFVEGQGHNDLETVVRQEYAAVDQVIKWLQQFAQPRMTGTGSGVFIQVDSRSEAASIARQMPIQWPFFVTQGLNVSPLIKK